MTDLYLIAHKVRGEAAFDVASRITCAICEGYTDGEGCAECDDTGYWWIIPTSGHRAYPYYSVELDCLGEEYNHGIRPGEMPPDLPDHYPHRAEAKRPALDISALIPKKPSAPIRRRA